MVSPINMSSQQSVIKTINNYPRGILSLNNRWNQIIVVFIWILCLISVEVSLVAAAPCTGTNEENCLSDCNVSCIAIACNNGTGECKNNTTEEKAPSTDTEEIVLPAPILTCEDETGECKNNTVEATVKNADTEANTSTEQILECEDKLGEFGDCENITTEGDIADTDEEENTQATLILPCEQGVYGAYCSLSCPTNCLGSKCDRVTGDCSNGCRIGYHGSECTETCPSGYHGQDCNSNCPVNCAANECHHENGYCLNGCKEDYWGSDCSLVGEFKDNPETSQDNFYQHLSAESKSVLLYMLMSKYEETLEKAQMEVSRGIRLRNKLRVIMGN